MRREGNWLRFSEMRSPSVDRYPPKFLVDKDRSPFWTKAENMVKQLKKISKEKLGLYIYMILSYNISQKLLMKISTIFISHLNVRQPK